MQRLGGCFRRTDTALCLRPQHIVECFWRAPGARANAVMAGVSHHINDQSADYGTDAQHNLESRKYDLQLQWPDADLLMVWW